jgi:pantoate--beta-alanine ligase
VKASTWLIAAQFFKGVATVCTKLFNAVEVRSAHGPADPSPIMPTLAKRTSNRHSSSKSVSTHPLTPLNPVLTDLLMAHPTPENLHILPTTRDSATHLALSSRNAYLNQAERSVAPILYRALSAARELYTSASISGKETPVTGEQMITSAVQVVLEEQARITDEREEVDLKVDYFEIFDKNTFEPLRGVVEAGRELVVAGAVWVGRTRLIDNLLLGWNVD